MVNWEFGKQVRHQISDIFEIPGEVILDLPRIVLTGNLNVLVENHKGIVKYTPQVVQVRVSDGILDFHGSDMVINRITTDEIYIEGFIESINYMSQRRPGQRAVE